MTRMATATPSRGTGASRHRLTIIGSPCLAPHQEAGVCSIRVRREVELALPRPPVARLGQRLFLPAHRRGDPAADLPRPWESELAAELTRKHPQSRWGTAHHFVESLRFVGPHRSVAGESRHPRPCSRSRVSPQALHDRALVATCCTGFLPREARRLAQIGEGWSPLYPSARTSPGLRPGPAPIELSVACNHLLLVGTRSHQARCVPFPPLPHPVEVEYDTASRLKRLTAYLGRRGRWVLASPTRGGDAWPRSRRYPDPSRRTP